MPLSSINKNLNIAKVIITFDDAHKSVYNLAYPILKNNHQKAVSYIITDNIGNLDNFNLSQAIEMKNFGWDLANHTKSHEHLTVISETEMHSQIDEAENYLSINNLTTKIFAYPFGEYNQTIIDYLISQNFKLARSTISGNQENIILSYNSPYLMKCYTIHKDDDVSLIYGYINAAISNKQLCILLFHQISNNPTIDLEYSTSKFESVSNFIKEKINSGLLKIMTMSEYYEEYNHLTGGADTKAINNDYPHEEGLNAGTTKQNKQPSLTYKQKNIKHSVWSP